MEARRIIYNAIYFLVTTLVIVGPALYNRYPLVYFDSGAYMEMAASMAPSFHRAIGYPILMKLTGWMISNWPIVFLQGFLVSILSFRLIKLIFSKEERWIHFAMIMTLSFSTSLSWYAAQLMPDIFTFLLAITVATIAFERNWNWRKHTVYGLLLFSEIITHLSHVPLLLLVLSAIIVLRDTTRLKIRRKAMHTMWAALVVSVMFTCTYNAIWGHGFRPSLASNVFITANLGEMGILKQYLDENCENSALDLCMIKDSLPLETGGYLWDQDGPVANHPGGWQGANEDYAPIVHDFLTTPKYLKLLLYSSFKSTIQQLFQIELGSGLQHTYGDGSPPSWPMHTHFKSELNEYLTSVQNKNADDLPLGFFRMLNYISLFLSLFILGWAVLNGHFDHRLLLLLLLFLMFYVFNAAITGVLANVYERLQCRLLPLFPMIAFMVWMKVIIEKKQS